MLAAEKHTMMAGQKKRKLLMVVVVLLATIAPSVDTKPTADKGEIHFGTCQLRKFPGLKKFLFKWN